MKKRLLVILISVVLFVFSAIPAYAAGSEPTTSGVEVTAKVEPVYVFAAPPSIFVNQSQTSVILGNFLVGDLFLESGEWLTLSVIPGVMMCTVNAAWTLPYYVDFNPPPIVNASDVGDSYEAKIRFDPGVLENAYTGTYQALLRFRVTSNPDGTIIWEGYTTVTVNVSGRTDSSPSEPVYSSMAASSQVTVSSNPSTPSKVSVLSKASTPSTSSTASEGQAGDTPDMGTTARIYELSVTVSIILVLAFLLLVLGRRRVKGKSR